jgi:hypothetical protein
MSTDRFVRTTVMPATSYAEKRIRVTGMGGRLVTPYGTELEGTDAHDAAVEKFQHHLGLDGRFQRLPTRDMQMGYRYELVGNNSKCGLCGSAL